MSVLIRETHRGKERRCDARCYNGKLTTKCKCICGGRNHAAGYERAVENNRRMFEDEEGAKLFRICSFPPGINRSKYEVASNVPGEPLVIRDIGHMDHRSVTNDAELVVADLVASGDLSEGRRLYYYDSMGILDEVLIKDSEFAGFAPGPERKAEPARVGREEV